MNYSARTIIAVSTAHLLLYGCSGTTEPKRPNILFIMSDDHAYQAISSYGHGLIQTPNIDRIANEGVRFNNCFVTNSLCGPSRAVILTGKYSNKNGFYDNGNVFDGEQQTMPKLFKAAGYQTAIFGKWHLKSTHQRGLIITASTMDKASITILTLWKMVKSGSITKGMPLILPQPI
jgi:arylsulfatase A-like enzyme